MAERDKARLVSTTAGNKAQWCADVPATHHQALSSLDESVSDSIAVVGFDAIAARVAGSEGDEPVVFPALYRRSKRILDIVVSSIGLVVLWPLFLVVGALIRLESPGPALFVQCRVGYRGRVFRMFKFRTMAAGSELQLDQLQKRRDDERVTRVGRWLRRTSIDELPQLINVVLGQMSLVGPRPELPVIVLERYAPWQYRRFLVPQGMTGWWQVTGRGAKLLCEHTEDDLFYIERATFRFDLLILAWTVSAVCRRDGAF